MKSSDILVESNPLKGILICLFAYFFVSLIGICEKSISSQVSLTVILFFQNIICLLLVIPEIIRNGVSLKTKYVGNYAIRIIAGLGCYALLFYIIRFMPISEAFLYQYSASLWIPFITLIWFNVEIERNIWFAIIIGFAGIVIILKPTLSMFGFISIMGIFCGILQGISVVAIRKLSVVEPTLRILFYYFFFGSAASSLLLINNWKPFKIIDFIYLLGVGVSTYLAQKFLTISLKYANATTLAPICYTSILFSGLLGWILWHEAPGNMTLFGMLLVIFGCVLSISVSRQKSIEENVLSC